MYQQFFYLTVSLSLIITTIVTVFLAAMIYNKNIGGPRRRRRQREESISEELQYRFECNLKKQQENILEIKIEIYTHICFLYELDSDEYKITHQKIEALQEQLNESRD